MNKLTQRAHKNFIIFPSRTILILPEKSVDNKFDVIGFSVYFILHFHKLDFLRQLSFNGLISLSAKFFVGIYRQQNKSTVSVEFFLKQPMGGQFIFLHLVEIMSPIVFAQKTSYKKELKQN